MRAFDFYAPSSTDEAVSLLDQFKTSAAIICGGTDIVIELNERERREQNIIDISHLDELKYIRESDGMLHIGATTTFETVEQNELIQHRYQALYDTVHYVGSPQIRRLGTIGGNIVSASVAGDTPTCFMAYDATVVLKSVRGIREMSIVDFSVNKGKCRCQIEPDELLLEVKFPIPKANEATAYQKFGKRKSLAIVVLACAIHIEKNQAGCVENARVVLGAVSLHPKRSSKLENALRGKALTLSALEETLPLFTEEIDAAIGSRPSVVYKREGIRGLAMNCYRDILKQFELV